MPQQHDGILSVFSKIKSLFLFLVAVDPCRMSDENNSSLRLEVKKLRQEMNQLRRSLLGNAQIQSENAQIECENAQIPSENAQSECENAQIPSENAQSECENAQIPSENAQNSAEASGAVTGRRAKSLWSDTVDEKSFSKELLKRPHKTSSPSSLLLSPPQSTYHDLPSCFMYRTLRDPRRLLGEIAFQLDRRILSYVFQEQSRLYGFTVWNIPDKIKQVSIHPLTGKADEVYRFHLSKRHMEIIDRLRILGYNTSLHPPFTEFMVNTYGILKEMPDAYEHQEAAFNNPEFLRKVVVETAPSKLLKDLLLLLSCLCFMARQDGKKLFLW